MLPTASAESPATRSRCATSAVVVVLPFVPVIATVRVLPPPPLPERARNPRSTSEKIGTPPARAGGVPIFSERSEEHTSELQSQSNLVCRLLLEKKKKHTILAIDKHATALMRNADAHYILEKSQLV